MNQLLSSAPVRLALVVAIAVVVQFVTHSSWFAIAVLVTYFVAKEIVGLMLGPGVAEAARAVEPRWRMAASVCDNLGFLTGLLGYFALQSAAPADGGTLWRFVAFEGGVVVLVAAWAIIVAAILRRVAAGAVKV
jgi:hypothetical protein